MAACIAEFRAHGFAGGRIERIAERAGVSKRTLYKHFSSKNAMFDAIAANAVMPLPRNSAPSFDPACPIAEQLTALLTQYMGVIATDEYVTVSRILVAEFIADPARSKGVSSRETMAAGPIENMMMQAMAAGLLRNADPIYAAAQLTGMLKTFFFWPRFLTGAEPLDEIEGRAIIDDAIAMFLSHYAPSSQFFKEG
jgi:TetR/AcrR family transcriptional regulator of autoinduction and epiphytic fitness